MFSQETAWLLLILLQPFVAVVCTYVYARKIRLNVFGAALSALSFGFSGFMSVWLEYNTVNHVIIWLPLILLAIEHIREKVSAPWILIFMASHVCAILGGHPQVYAYVMVFSICYGLVRVPKSSWWIPGTGLLLAFGMSALQILPGFELIANSARSAHEFNTLFTKILIQPWQLLSLPFPNLFGNPATRSYWPSDTFIGKVLTIGLVPLFFLPSAFRQKNTVSSFFAFAAIFVLLLVTANPITYVLYRIPIPLITSSSPTLMAFLLAFALSMLGGIGLDFWIRDTHSIRKLIVRTIEVLVIILGIAGFSRLPIVPEFQTHSGTAVRALMYAGVISMMTLCLFYLFIRFRTLKTLALVGMLLVNALDLFVFFNRFNPFVPRALMYPNHPVFTFLQSVGPERFWGYGTARIDSNIASHYGVYSPEGYDPLYYQWYGSFLYAYKTGKALTQFDGRTRSDAAIDSSFTDTGLGTGFKKRMLDAVSVRYILDRKENASSERIFPPDSFKMVKTINDWSVYENLDAVPRAFIAKSVKVADDTESFSSQFFSNDFDPKSTALIPHIADISTYQNASGTASILEYDAELVTVQTNTKTAALLVVTDTFDPNWSADIDGSPAEIIPTNLSQRGIPIPPGEHTVRMAYQPHSVTIGFWASIISIALSAMWLVMLKKQTS